MIEIPEKLRGFNFVLCNDKNPIEKGWTEKIHRFDDPVLLKHLKNGKNYGIQPNNSSLTIEGNNYFLIIVDFDDRKFQDSVLSMLPKTFMTSSGSPKNCCHLWFASDNNKAFKIKNEKLETLCDVLGSGNFIVAPGSKHSSGSTYHVVSDIPISFITYSELCAILKPFDKSPKKPEKLKKEFSIKGVEKDLNQKILNSVSLRDVLSELSIDTSRNPTGCPFHSSKGGKCFSFNNDVAHCFHCDGAWNAYSLIKEAKKFSDKETFEWFAEKGGLTEELKKAREEYNKKRRKDREEEKKVVNEIFTLRGQIESFWKIYPFFFDKSKIFWVWNDEFKRWEQSDEIELSNEINRILNLDTLDNKKRSEITAGLRQVGRRHIPKDSEKTWVQFKDKIYDVRTFDGKGNGVFPASPEYFVTNPIPWSVGEKEETPEIDNLFKAWVHDGWEKTLYEIIAYNVSSNKFMQRIFALCGGGSNGKSTFIKLNYKFLGNDNCVTSELKNLSEDKFEPAVLYKKLLCVMGEVSYDDLKNTNQLKKLGGEDKLSFQFKGKTPFTGDNTATCVCLTNSLPKTPDKSRGFYRKWLIVDFPNQFEDIKEDVIGKIPKGEFENLALKCLNILKELYQKSKFNREGDFEERTKRYEERSNPVMQFVLEKCEEEPDKVVPLRDFANACNSFLKGKHLRVLNAKQIGKTLREEGFIVGNRKINNISSVVIVNLSLKEDIETIKTIKNQTRSLYKGTNMKMDSFDSFDNLKTEVTHEKIVLGGQQ